MPNNDPIQYAKDALDKAIETERRNKRFLEAIGPAIVSGIVSALEPMLRKITDHLKHNSSEVRDAVSKVEMHPTFQVPDIKVPDIKLPEIKVPDVYVTVPPIKVPESKVTVNVPPIKIPKQDIRVTMPSEL